MWSAKSVRAKTEDPASREATVETVADATDTATADPAASVLLVRSVLRVATARLPRQKAEKTVKTVAAASAAVPEASSVLTEAIAQHAKSVRAAKTAQHAKTALHAKTVQHAKTAQLGTIARELKETAEEETVEPVDQTVAEAAPEVQTV
jgi:hypothetical protein